MKKLLNRFFEYWPIVGLAILLPALAVSQTVYPAGTLGGSQILPYQLNALFTDVTGTLTNTNLTATVSNGVTYAITLAAYVVDTTAADGAKLDLGGGTATTSLYRLQCVTSDISGAIVPMSPGSASTLTTALSPTLATTTTNAVICTGFLVASSSGTLILRAAQNAHTTGTLTLLRGSWLVVQPTILQ